MTKVLIHIYTVYIYIKQKREAILCLWKNLEAKETTYDLKIIYLTGLEKASIHIWYKHTDVV